MRYDPIVLSTFVERQNRFVATVTINGIQQTVHVKNTGRCRELLRPGATVVLCHQPTLTRKTAYDLVAVYKQTGKGVKLINMDSQAPNRAVYEWLPRSGLFSDTACFRPETVYGRSRFDFSFTDGPKKGFMEVKGVTLEQDGLVSFPDAPTTRGVKHLQELIRCVADGYEAYLVFLVQMSDVRLFVPNEENDPAFTRALRQAARAGVHILCYDCIVTASELIVNEPVPIDLSVSKFAETQH